eukprot:TRINITY_DN2451_c0_g1_i2.p1 TRINITY_DN2451_c0_g1~~TRINITY_DN2451_c0_g1_i2.p1  ORF type:complete len:1759 (+),score=589.32 TRINITY_DN2451_c0_g1_i2:236-5512(+)
MAPQGPVAMVLLAVAVVALHGHEVAPLLEEQPEAAGLPRLTLDRPAPGAANPSPPPGQAQTPELGKMDGTDDGRSHNTTEAPGDKHPSQGYRLQLHALRMRVAALWENRSAAEARVMSGQKQLAGFELELGSKVEILHQLDEQLQGAKELKGSAMDAMRAADDQLTIAQQDVDKLLQQSKTGSDTLVAERTRLASKLNQAHQEVIRGRQDLLGLSATWTPKIIQAKGVVTQARLTLARARDKVLNDKVVQAREQASAARERIVQVREQMAEAVRVATKEEERARLEEAPGELEAIRQHLAQLERAADDAKTSWHKAVAGVQLAEKQLAHVKGLGQKGLSELTRTQAQTHEAAERAEIEREATAKKLSEMKTALVDAVETEKKARVSGSKLGEHQQDLDRATAEASAASLKLKAARDGVERLARQKLRSMEASQSAKASEIFATVAAEQGQREVRKMARVRDEAGTAKRIVDENLGHAEYEAKRLEAKYHNALLAERVEVSEAGDETVGAKERAAHALSAQKKILRTRENELERVRAETQQKKTRLGERLKILEAELGPSEQAASDQAARASDEITKDLARTKTEISKAEKKAAQEEAWAQDDFRQRQQMAEENRKFDLEDSDDRLREASKAERETAAAAGMAAHSAREAMESVQHQVSEMVVAAHERAVAAKAAADKAASLLLSKAKQASASERNIEQRLPANEQLSTVPSDCGCGGGGLLGDSEVADLGHDCPCATERPRLKESMESSTIPESYDSAADALAQQEIYARSVQDAVETGKKQVKSASDELKTAKQRGQKVLADAEAHSKQQEAIAVKAHKRAEARLRAANQYSQSSHHQAAHRYDVAMDAATKDKVTRIQAIRFALSQTIATLQADHSSLKRKLDLGIKFTSDSIAAHKLEHTRIQHEYADACKQATRIAHQAARQTSKADQALHQSEAKYEAAVKQAETHRSDKSDQASGAVKIAKIQAEETAKVLPKLEEEVTQSRALVQAAQVKLDSGKKYVAAAAVAKQKAVSLQASEADKADATRTDLRIAKDQVSSLMRQASKAEKKAAGAKAWLALETQRVQASLRDLKHRAQAGAARLDKLNQELSQQAKKATMLKYLDDKQAAQLRELHQPSDAQLIAEDQLDRARTALASARMRLESAAHQVSSATVTSKDQKLRLRSRLQRLAKEVERQRALASDRVNAAEVAAKHYDRIVARTLAAHETAQEAVLAAQRGFDQASSGLEELEGQYARVRGEKQESLERSSAVVEIGKAELSEMLTAISRSEQGTKEVLDQERPRLDKASADKAAAQERLEESEETIKRVTAKEVVGQAEATRLREAVAATAKQLTTDKAQVERLGAEYKSQKRVLAMGEARLVNSEREQAWADLETKKKAAEVKIVKARQAGVKANQLLLDMQRAAVDLKQRAVDRKQALLDAHEGERMNLTTWSHGVISKANRDIDQAEHDSKLVRDSASSGVAQASVDVVRFRQRARLQTEAADKKVEAVQSKAAKFEDAAVAAKSMAGTLQLAAARRSKQAAELRDAAARAKESLQEAEKLRGSVELSFKELHKSGLVQVSEAQRVKANAALGLSWSRTELKQLEESVPRTESYVDKLQEQARTAAVAEARMRDESEAAVEAAKAAAKAARLEMKRQRAEVKVVSEQMVEHVQDSMRHKMTMDAMAYETQRYVAENQAKTRGVHAVRDAKLEILEHTRTRMEAGMRHGYAHDTIKQHTQIKQEAAELTKAFIESSLLANSSHVKSMTNSSSVV